MIDQNPSRILAACSRAGCFIAIGKPLPGRKPVLAPLLRLLWAALFLLTTFGAHADVFLTTLY